VHKCRNQLGALFALKTVKVTSEKLLSITIREYETLQKLQHPNIVKVYDLFLQSDTQEAAISMTLLPGQPLSSLLREGHKFTESEVKSVARQMLSALSYMKEQGLAHRDINPANIMLSEGHATLIDFQTAVSLSPAPSGPAGTAPYQAPEMLLFSGYDAKVDVWALGLVLQRLVRSFESPCSAAGLEMIALCLQSDPSQRCSAEEALKSDWLL
jgi:serine/threonine protein kinase